MSNIRTSETGSNRGIPAIVMTTGAPQRGSRPGAGFGTAAAKPTRADADFAGRDAHGRPPGHAAAWPDAGHQPDIEQPLGVRSLGPTHISSPFTQTYPVQDVTKIPSMASDRGTHEVQGQG